MVKKHSGPVERVNVSCRYGIYNAEHLHGIGGIKSMQTVRIVEVAAARRFDVLRQTKLILVEQ